MEDKSIKRIMVDMSATILHHGHIRLLKRASTYGNVIVALTTDKEILQKKGYQPELSFDFRREILLSIKYVNEVIPSPWLIDEDFLDLNRIDFLIHGSDNSNPISKKRLLIFERTEGISSSIIRKKVLDIGKKINLN